MPSFSYYAFGAKWCIVSVKYIEWCILVHRVDITYFYYKAHIRNPSQTIYLFFKISLKTQTTHVKTEVVQDHFCIKRDVLTCPELSLVKCR